MPAAKDRLAELLASLPAPERARTGDDPEERARGMLALLIERARTVDSPAAVPSDTAACPNCSIPVASTRSPYCGEQCREVAGFVRHVRSGLVEGSILVPDRQVAVGQVLWHILGGGRPLRREIAPKRSLETAFKREGGKCQGCGAPATTVDHIGSGCNRPINLRAVCGDCCLDRAFGDPLVTGRPGYTKLFDELAARVASPHPVRCCDDAATWDWRAHVRSRT